MSSVVTTTRAAAVRPKTEAHAPLAGNRLGRLFCLTLFTPVRRRWDLFLRAGFWAAKWIPLAHKHILQFNFIHFVRWTLVKELPYNGAPQQREQLNYTYLFFESNFDGPWQHYIDAFAYCIPFDIRFVWGRGPDFPSPPPAEPLKAWIARNSMEGGSYYCAYPNASTRMVKGAVEVRNELQKLIAESTSLTPAQFKTRYEAFLTRVQAHL